MTSFPSNFGPSVNNALQKAANKIEIDRKRNDAQERAKQAELDDLKKQGIIFPPKD